MLVFTKTAGERHASTAAGVSALRARGQQHRFTVVETNDASQTFPLADPGGLHELFLVFRPVAGGPTNNFFGPGISVNQ